MASMPQLEWIGEAIREAHEREQARYIPVRRLMWLSEVNEVPVQLTDYSQDHRLALIYALLDLEYPTTLSLESDDGVVHTYWLEDQ